MNEPSTVPHAAVIGWPVEHSLSPVIHGYWLRHYGIAGSYEKLLVSPDELSSVLSRLQNRGLVGANVTIPHKIAALQAVDRVTAVAERIGAVNTLYFDLFGAGNPPFFGYPASLVFLRFFLAKSHSRKESSLREEIQGGDLFG